MFQSYSRGKKRTLNYGEHVSFSSKITWLTRTTRWSWSCCIIISQTVVLPDAAPPATPAMQSKKWLFSREWKEIWKRPCSSYYAFLKIKIKKKETLYVERYSTTFVRLLNKQTNEFDKVRSKNFIMGICSVLTVFELINHYNQKVQAYTYFSPMKDDIYLVKKSKL